MPYEKFVGETRKSGIVNSRTSLQSLLQDTEALAMIHQWVKEK